MSSLKEKVKALDERAPKVEKVIDDLVKAAQEKKEWQNVRLMRGKWVQVLLTSTPDGMLMIRICGQRLKNCLKVTRAAQLHELLETIAILGNAEKVIEVLEKKLSEINGDVGTEILDVW